ncbi:MAG: HD domain-containing protein [Spirochaetaceae bacterium]|nr:HD domain-containing protein [Spirochaetaceae bacterium]
MTPASPHDAAARRLHEQIDFLCAIDELKGVLRQTSLLDASRRENSAEHSWHLALYALVLAEYAEGDIDLARVLRMVLVHDIVEIDAGDTYIYDDTGRETKEERERQAADRLFALLPDDQAGVLRAAWDEFEERRTPEARFAYAIDRLQPLLHNHRTHGFAWRRHGITVDQVYEKNHPIGDGAPRLWELARELVETSAQRGDLKR